MQNGKLILDEARLRTPPVSPMEALRKAAANGLTGAVKEQDVAEVVGKLKEMALAGNLKAVEMYLKLTIGGDKPRAEPAATDGQGLKMLASALQDLVDEVRIGKAKAECKLLTDDQGDD